MTRWMFACACAASALVLGLAPPASAAWPDRPIRLASQCATRADFGIIEPSAR